MILCLENIALGEVGEAYIRKSTSHNQLSTDEFMCTTSLNSSGSSVVNIPVQKYTIFPKRGFHLN